MTLCQFCDNKAVMDLNLVSYRRYRIYFGVKWLPVCDECGIWALAEIEMGTLELNAPSFAQVMAQIKFSSADNNNNGGSSV